jgi:RNA recognition motif-containing protein
VGNIHTKVTDALLAEVFSSVGPLEGCKLIRKEKSSYGFVDYFDHRSAAAALLSLNGRQMFGQPIKVNWAYVSGQREDTTGYLQSLVSFVYAMNDWYKRQIYLLARFCLLLLVPVRGKICLVWSSVL